jgi:lambda family phage portal protein
MLRAIGIGKPVQGRGFAAAQITRLNSDWLTSALSADLETQGGLQKMRERSRSLANDNDYAKKFLALLEKNVVGAWGIRLQSKIPVEVLGGFDAANKEIERAWKDWGKKRNCSTSGRLCWIDVKKLAIRTMAQDGECFIRMRRYFRNSEHGFALEFIDADQVDIGLNRLRRQTATGIQNEIRMGVEVDEFRRPVQYWIWKGHPSEGRNANQYVQIPAEEMIHLHLFRRINETRGVPWLHTACNNLHMKGEYVKAEVAAARAGASKMGFIYSEGPDADYDSAEETDSGELEIKVGPLQIGQLPHNKKFQAWDPQHPNAIFPEFIKAMLRSIASGMDVSYASLANDLREVNFSSIRVGLLEERDTYRMLHSFLIEHLITDVFDAWLPIALLKTINLPYRMPSLYSFPKWLPRGFAWVDPMKDATANQLRLAMGLTNLEELCAEEGKDWEEVAMQRKKEIDRFSELGLEASAQVAAPTDPGTNQEGDSNGNSGNYA